MVKDKELQLLKSWPVFMKDEKRWQPQILIDDEQEKVYRRTITWRILKDGSPSKKRVSSPYEVTAKNVGRSNETTPLEQAKSEVGSMVQKKRDKGYHLPSEEPPEILLRPMLAHRYDKRGHDIEFPCFTQPKLDGIRMLTDGQKAWTRKGKEHIPEVVEHVLQELDLPDGVVLDGEIMLPSPHTFQQTVKAVKKFYPGLSPKLLYYVFDLYDENKPKLAYGERYKQLLSMGLGNSNKLVRCNTCHDESELFEEHGKNVSMGYEGTMVRNIDSAYQPDKRSKHLQKLKPMMSDEFEIVDVIDGEGSESGLAIFKCEVPGAEEPVTVRPRGSHEERAEWFDNRSNFIGKMLTVEFQEYTDEGSLRIPTGVAVRDYE